MFFNKIRIPLMYTQESIYPVQVLSHLSVLTGLFSIFHCTNVTFRITGLLKLVAKGLESFLDKPIGCVWLKKPE